LARQPRSPSACSGPSVTFVIWPYGPEKLNYFLKYLSSIQKYVHFTVKSEKTLPFLNISVYRRPDGSFGHKVYRILTHTTLNNALLSTLAHRVKAI